MLSWSLHSGGKITEPSAFVFILTTHTHLNLNGFPCLLLKQLKTVFWWHNPSCVQDQTWTTNKVSSGWSGSEVRTQAVSTHTPWPLLLQFLQWTLGVFRDQFDTPTQGYFHINSITWRNPSKACLHSLPSSFPSLGLHLSLFLHNNNIIGFLVFLIIAIIMRVIT